MTEKISNTERPFHLKLSKQDRQKLDDMANALQVDRSVVLRMLLRQARISEVELRLGNE